MEAVISSFVVFVIGFIVVGVIWDFVAKLIGKRKP